MPDKDDVQQGEVSEGTESTEPKTEETGQAQPQYLTREEAEQMLAQEREKIKQSSRDISRAEIERAKEAQMFAETKVAGYQKGLGGLDPEQARAIQAEAELAAYRQKDSLGRQSQYTKQLSDTFHNQMTQFITSMGFDPNDKRIDWADDTPDGSLLSRQQRILTSVAKAQKEDAKKAEEKRSQEVKDLEARLRKDLGIDSVSTEQAPAVGGKRIFSQEEIADRKFYDEHKDEILEAYKAGRIREK